MHFMYLFLQQLQEDVDNHREHHEAVNNTADQLLSRTDVDHPFIKEQVGDANRRWDELQKGEIMCSPVSWQWFYFSWGIDQGHYVYQVEIMFAFVSWQCLYYCC